MLVDGGGRRRRGELASCRCSSTAACADSTRSCSRTRIPIIAAASPAVSSHLDVDELWLSPRRFRGDCAALLLRSRSARRSVSSATASNARARRHPRSTRSSPDRTLPPRAGEQRLGRPARRRPAGAGSSSPATSNGGELVLDRSRTPRRRPQGRPSRQPQLDLAASARRCRPAHRRHLLRPPQPLRPSASGGPRRSRRAAYPHAGAPIATARSTST